MSSPNRPTVDTLRDLVGSVDVYLFDQILKGRFAPGCRILDAGCGGGRNLVFFLRAGYPVFGVDRELASVESTRRLAARLAPDLPRENFRAEPLEELSFDDGSFDAVLASAVLHFARDTRHFKAMLTELWRVLAPGGFFFARLASTIGIEDRVEPLRDRRFHLPDGSDRFLVDEALLTDYASALGAEQAEPIKTTNVQNLRAMTTWCLVKSVPD